MRMFLFPRGQRFGNQFPGGSLSRVVSTQATSRVAPTPTTQAAQVARHSCSRSPQAGRLARRPKRRLPTIRISTSPATSRGSSVRASCGISFFRSRRSTDSHVQRAPRRSALRTGSGTVIQRGIAALDCIPGWFIALAARIFPAAVFWQSGQTKVAGWHLKPSAISLFENEYQLPLVAPTIAAYVSAFSEHSFESCS